MIICYGSLRILMKESESRSVVSDSLWPHRLYSPCNSPGQNTGVSSHSLLQGIILTQESNPGLLHCRWILYQLRGLWMKEKQERKRQGSPMGEGVPWNVMDWNTEGAISIVSFTFPFSPPPSFVWADLCLLVFYWSWDHRLELRAAKASLG